MNPPRMKDGQPSAVTTSRPRRRRRNSRRFDVVKTLWPPQAGTVKLSHRYGPALLCVRYRHDEDGLRRYTTVELIVDEARLTNRLSRYGIAQQDSDAHDALELQGEHEMFGDDQP